MPLKADGRRFISTRNAATQGGLAQNLKQKKKKKEWVQMLLCSFGSPTAADQLRRPRQNLNFF